MSIVNFYDKFHQGAKPQHKLINDKNITYRIIISELKSYLTLANLKIYDYGCGVGTLDFYLASLNNKVTGVDLSDSAIRLANKSKNELKLKKYCTFNVVKSTKLNSRLKYDLIICSEVIEHVPNDLYLINYFNKIIKNKGYLFITTPSINAPLFKLGMLKKFDLAVGHKRRYNIEKLTALLQRGKFEIIFINKTEGILRNLLYTNRNLGFILKFIKGPISDLFTRVDNIFIYLFGESNYHILAKRKDLP